MKAKIIITPKKAVLDPQGKTVQTALEHMGYTGVTGVHIGKYIEIDLAPGTDKAAATKAINDAAHKLLSNPVIEDYKLEIPECGAPRAPPPPPPPPRTSLSFNFPPATATRTPSTASACSAIPRGLSGTRMPRSVIPTVSSCLVVSVTAIICAAARSRGSAP